MKNKANSPRVTDATVTPVKKLVELIKDDDCKVIIAFSGGKDSVDAFLQAHYRWKIPLGRIELWHHEIDGGGEQLFDWACTPSYCQAFADAFNVPILFSYRKGGILREMYRTNETSQSVFYQAEAGGKYIELESQQKEKFMTTRRKFPAVSADLRTRWCSGKVKIDVMNRAISHRFQNSEKVIVITGERREESNNRAKYDIVKWHSTNSSKRTVIHWRNILDRTEQQVWDNMKAHRIQPHPCYCLGYSRCSCRTCIFLDAHGWASTAELTPNAIGRFDEIEKDFNFTLYNGIGIRDKVAKGKSFIPPAMKERWLKEALGEFVSPIFIDDWQLPAGAFSKHKSGAV